MVCRKGQHSACDRKYRHPWKENGTGRRIYDRGWNEWSCKPQGHHLTSPIRGIMQPWSWTRHFLSENIDSGPFIELNGGLNNTFSNVMQKNWPLLFLVDLLPIIPDGGINYAGFSGNHIPKPFRFIPAGIPSLVVCRIHSVCNPMYWIKGLLICFSLKQQ